MPTGDNKEILETVQWLFQVMDPEVQVALSDLIFVTNPPNTFGGPVKRNPAIYINKKGARLVNTLNDKFKENNKNVRSVISNTIVTQNKNFPRGLLYGVLLHEMAHAWAERCGFLNNEENAYLFEIQWVCTLAADTKHPYSNEMRIALSEYFNDRIEYARYTPKAIEYLKWSLAVHGLSDLVTLR